MNALFIAYHPVSYPIMESQGFSYMRGLSKNNVLYTLLSFETKETLGNSKKYISESNMILKWRYLNYHSKPRFLATFYDTICGILKVILTIKKDKIEIIHARGFIAALIAFLPSKVLGVKLFFDTRGLLADKYVGGGLLVKDSFTYKLMKWGEDILVKKSDYFTVETYQHAKIIRSSQNSVSGKMEVIPCCVDMNKFNYSLFYNKSNNGEKFILVYMGKVGTWYLFEKMLDFFNSMSTLIPHSRFSFLTESDAASIYSGAMEKGIDESKINITKAETSEVPRLLSIANAGIFFINPYKRYNSSPIKFGEYLASGLPVIVNAGIGDCDDIILKERVGVIINEFSLKEYERAINELKGLLSEGERLRERCRRVAEKYFSLEMGVERYWEIYRKLRKELY